MTDLERGKQLYEEALNLESEKCWSTGYYNDLRGEAVCYELPGDKAYDLMVEAAKLGYPDAQYELGLYYVFRGQNRAVPADGEAAEKRRNENREECIAGFDWIKAAAAAGHVKAASTVGHMLFLGNEQSGSIAPDNAAAIPYLEIAAQSDDLAMYHLGRAYEGGYGVPQDDKKAFFWFEKSAKAGNTFSPAWTPLGECYLFGKGTTKDIPKAKEAFVGPALLGAPRAQLLLGGIYMGGVGFEYADFSKAELALSKISADAKEYENAQVLLAALPDYKEQYRKWQLRQGNTEQQEEGASQDIPNSTQQTEKESVTDLERAIALYDEAINLSEERWCEGVYVSYGNRCFGRFSEPVGQKGRDLMTEAAEMGLPAAQYQLGLFFLFEDKHRREMDVDYEDILDVEQQRLSVIWLRNAANQGHGEAALVLGDLYMNRIENVELLMAGDVRGFQAYQMGAEGDCETMCRLGECYFLGKGTEKNYAAAFECFEKAKWESLTAYYFLGECYGNGYGTQRNTEKAIECFLKALNTVYNESACVKLGAIYMGGNEPEYTDVSKAREYLQQVDGNKNPTAYRAAQELLKQLDEREQKQKKTSSLSEPSKPAVRSQPNPQKTGGASTKGVVLGAAIAIVVVIAAILIIGSGGNGNSSHGNGGYVPPSSYEEPDVPSNPVPSSNPYHQCYYTAHGGNLLPASDSRYYEKSELAHLNKQELVIARNEIYARYGYIFKSENLAEYFEACDWYSGTVSSSNFSDSIFNKYEKANIKTITELEKEKGYRS